MSDEDIIPRKRGFGWGRVLLAGSLALNLLVLGMAGGLVLNRMDEHHRAPSPERILMRYGPYARALSPEDRLALRDDLRREASQLRAGRQDLRRDFDRLFAALRAQPYDPEAVSAAIEAQQGRVRAQVDEVQRMLLERVSAMSAEERAGFADRLERILRHGPPHHAPEDGG